jgi:hypothetical protein
VAPYIEISLHLLKSRSVILYTVILFLLLFFGFRHWNVLRVEGLHPWTTAIAFALKVLMSFGFLFVYTEVLGHGTLSEDAGVFMQESRALYSVFWQDPLAYFKLLTGLGESQELIATYLGNTTHWDVGAQSLINDNKNVLRAHSLVHFISFNSVVIHAFIWCAVGVIGVKQLYLAIAPMTKVRNSILFWSLLLLPSAFFWTSSILKEPFMLLGFGLLLRGIFSVDHMRSRFIFVLLGALLLLGFKPYVFIVFIPTLLFFLFARILPKYKIAGALFLLLTLLISASFLFSGMRETAIHRLSRKQFDFVQVGRGGVHVYADSLFYYFTPEQSGSLHRLGDSVWLKHDMDAKILKLGEISEPVPVHLKADGTKWFKYFENNQSRGFISVTPINNSYKQLVYNTPEALYHALIRPLPNDPGGSLNTVAFIETLLLFIALALAIYYRKQLSHTEQVRLVGLFIFVVLLSLLIGWTTPVLGAIARYRIPVYLTLLSIAAILYAHEKKTTPHE